MNNRIWLVSIVILGLLLSLGSVGPATRLSTRAASAGAVLYVKAEPSSAMNCTSWDNACTLQTALGIATPGDEIWVQEGVYKPVDGIGYASCQEIRDAFPDGANGDYLINHGGDVFQVYCDNMDSTPVEYVTFDDGIRTILRRSYPSTTDSLISNLSGVCQCKHS